MTIDAISFLPPVAAAGIANAETSAPVPGASGQFATWFTQQLSDVNDQLAIADHGVQQLAAGDAPSLHQVMINLEQARLSMQLVMQVRGHLLDVYHDLMQMQV